MANKLVTSIVFSAGAATGALSSFYAGQIDYDELTPRHVVDTATMTDVVALAVAEGWNISNDGFPLAVHCLSRDAQLMCFAYGPNTRILAHPLSEAEISALTALATDLGIEDLAKLRDLECNAEGDGITCQAVVRKTSTPSDVATLMDGGLVESLNVKTE